MKELVEKNTGFRIVNLHASGLLHGARGNRISISVGRDACNSRKVNLHLLFWVV